MSIELPKDAEGREIPLDTVALFNRVGNVYSIASAYTLTSTGKRSSTATSA